MTHMIQGDPLLSITAKEVTMTNQQYPQLIPSQDQREQSEQPRQQPNTTKLIAQEALPSMIMRGTVILVACILAFFVLWIAASFISALGDEAERFFKHMTGLFHRAPYMFQSSNGFAAFVQLIAIAVFVGWAASRFMRKR